MVNGDYGDGGDDDDNDDGISSCFHFSNLRLWTRGFSGSRSRAKGRLSLAWQDNVSVR